MVGVDDLGETYELAWDISIKKKGYRKGGVSGYCKVISRSSGSAIPPGLIRVHLCKHNPCQARWEHECNYGELGFPMHVQLAEDWRPLASLEAPAPVPPPAAVHSHPVEAPLGPREGDDGVPEALADHYFWLPGEIPQDTAVADLSLIHI